MYHCPSSDNGWQFITVIYRWHSDLNASCDGTYPFDGFSQLLDIWYLFEMTNCDWVACGRPFIIPVVWQEFKGHACNYFGRCTSLLMSSYRIHLSLYITISLQTLVYRRILVLVIHNDYRVHQCFIKSVMGWQRSKLSHYVHWVSLMRDAKILRLTNLFTLAKSTM